MDMKTKKSGQIDPFFISDSKWKLAFRSKREKFSQYFESLWFFSFFVLKKEER